MFGYSFRKLFFVLKNKENKENTDNYIWFPFFLYSITWITQKILGVYLCMAFEICFFVLKNKGNKENTKTTYLNL